ncbi:hypothetical protein ACFQ4U_14840 [Micrococcus antarcticus]
MPIVLAQPHERLDDVMGLVSIHGRSAVVAIYDEPDDHLSFWYVSLPNPALENVLAEPQGQTVGEFIAHGTLDGARTFRVRYWAHSAITFEIPCYVRSDLEHRTSYNTHLGALGKSQAEDSLEDRELAD